MKTSFSVVGECFITSNWYQQFQHCGETLRPFKVNEKRLANVIFIEFIGHVLRLLWQRAIVNADLRNVISQFGSLLTRSHPDSRRLNPMDVNVICVEFMSIFLLNFQCDNSLIHSIFRFESIQFNWIIDAMDSSGKPDLRAG